MPWLTVLDTDSGHPWQSFFQKLDLISWALIYRCFQADGFTPAEQSDLVGANNLQHWLHPCLTSADGASMALQTLKMASHRPKTAVIAQHACKRVN